ncbi:hypothetical protein [Streptacidiphilus sp. EB129]|uniref:hypothetical protein n=1 Tax=Streptacidiphilus sp. EB129 TaxID=3156262 RepID=UPI003516C517
MKHVRLGIAASAAAIVLALMPSGAGAAARNQQTPASSCSDHSLAAPNQSLNPLPTARRAGQKIDIFAPVHNTQSTTRYNTLFYLQLAYADAGTGHVSGTPTVWWRVDHGPWKLIHFTFHRGRHNVNAPYWDTSELPMGTFAAHQTKTVEISTSFSALSSNGSYFGYEGFSIPSCQPGGPWYQGTSSFSLYYQPSSRR